MTFTMTSKKVYFLLKRKITFSLETVLLMPFEMSYNSTSTKVVYEKNRKKNATKQFKNAAT